MYRKLPVAVVEDVVFCVDAEREELWQATGPENRIPFNAFHYQQGGYYCLYNRKLCLAAARKEEVFGHIKDYCWVSLPAPMELDPEGMALRYGILLEVLCPDSAQHPPGKIIAEIIPVRRKHLLQLSE